MEILQCVKSTPQNGRPPYDGGFSDRQAVKRNTLGSSGHSLLRDNSYQIALILVREPYIVIGLQGYCSPY